MKTAISVPDETFERASRRAHDLGMSRSEFFSRAADRYVDELDSTSATREIDDAIVALSAADESSTDAAEVARRLLGGIVDEW